MSSRDDNRDRKVPVPRIQFLNSRDVPRNQKNNSRDDVMGYENNPTVRGGIGRINKTKLQ